MLLRRYAIFLLLIIIDDQNGVSTTAIDLLPFNDKHEILRTIERRVEIEQNHDSKKRHLKESVDDCNNVNTDQCCSSNAHDNSNNQNHFFDVFTSRYDVNEPIPDVYCSPSAASSLGFRLEKTIDQLNKNLNLGQKLEFNTDSVSVTFEKVSSNNITGKHLTQSNGAEIRFPELNLNQTTTINLMTLPSLSIVSLTLHDQSGEIMHIKNTTDPFEILIPHQTNQLMPSMIRQNVTSSSKTTNFNYHYINLTHHRNLSISLHIDIEPENANLSYLLIIRFSGMPDLKAKLVDDRKLMCPEDRETRSLKYRYFIDNTRIAHHQWAVVGIREMKECNDDNIHDPIQFSSDYSIGVYSSGCYYLDNNHQWQSDGLAVGAKTNERFTQCYSTHLTTFASGFLVLPNPIAFNKSFNPKDNLTIYLTLIILGLIYLVTMGFSHYKDKIDTQKLMVMPLRDNNQQDTYLYQLVVFTGMRANAGTKSKVHFILSGADDETATRTLAADRLILERGGTDSFIMAVPRTLGPLNYLRIWHDNSGFDSDASWYLKYILVRDLQTMETTYFICEKWLAVEKDSGEIDRTIGAAGELEKIEMRYVLSKNAYRSMADNHLWFSIFAYHVPSATRFTRVQRCTCCFVLLFTSLLMNVFYFDITQVNEENQINQHGLMIGPFHISQEGMSISVITELIVFFPSLLLVALFRRSKARRPRVVSPVGEAIENIRSKKYVTGNPAAKEKRFLLPWWCLIVAYILSFLMALIAVAFILIRCVQYGDAKTQQWLGTILTNFFASVLLVQPLKVFSLALLFMCLCRKKTQSDAFIEHEDPIEDFTVSAEDANRKLPSKNLLAKTGLDPHRTRREKSTLKKLREIRLKEVEAWFILRELFFLLLFLGVLYAISFANRDVGNARWMVHHLRREFLQIDHQHDQQYIVEEGKEQSNVFQNIRSINDYWKWLEEVFLERLPKVRRNNEKHDKNATQTNTIIGFPMLRQLRVKNDSCPRKAFRDRLNIDDCNLPYTWYNEGKEPFGWNIHANDSDKFRQAFKYTSTGDKTLIYSTAHATYMGGGYVHDFRLYNFNKILSGVQYLQEHRWFDRYTRAIFLTFGLYNANANLFVHCSLLMEQLPTTGQLMLRPSFQPFKLTQLYTGAEVIYCLVYLVLIVYYMYAEIKLIFQMRKAYIKHFWSYMNWGIIVCSWFGVVIHFLRQAEMKRMAKSLKAGAGSTVSLQFFAYLDTLLTYLLGFCCFFGTLKILRLLRFNRHLSLLHLTLQKSARQIIGFLMMFFVVFTAFTTLFYLLFHPHVREYSTWVASALTCFEMVSLHFTTVTDLKRIDPLIAGLCLFIFIFLAVFLLSNMFISIIVDNFNLIRREQMKKANDVELLQFVIKKIKRWTGMRSQTEEMEKNKNPVIALPEKIDQLMLAIDKIHKDITH